MAVGKIATQSHPMMPYSSATMVRSRKSGSPDRSACSCSTNSKTLSDLFSISFIGTQRGCCCIQPLPPALNTTPQGPGVALASDETRKSLEHFTCRSSSLDLRSWFSSSANQHAVPIAVEAIAGFHRVLVGPKYIFSTSERTDQRKQRRAGQMEVGE